MQSDFTTKRLNSAFAALADPTRRAIVQRLANGKATPTELAEPFALSQPTISRHLKVLEDAGLIITERDAQRRIRQIDHTALKDVANWLDPFRQLWEIRLDRLDAHLGNSKPKEKK